MKKGKKLWTVGSCERKGKRSTMEDTMLVVDPFKLPVESTHQQGVQQEEEGLLLAVFDGHNGGRCANFLREKFSERFQSNLLHFMKEGLSKEEINLAITNTFLGLDKEWLEQEDYEDGSTGICIFIYHDLLTVAHVGDSRAILSTNENTYILSKDHKPTEETEMERIKATGGSVIGGRLYGRLDVSRSFGDRAFKIQNSGLTCEPEINHMHLSSRHCFLVVGCDGLYECFENDRSPNTDADQIPKTLHEKDTFRVESDNDIIKFLTMNDDGKISPDGLAELLVTEALDRGTEDNVTAIVVKFEKKAMKKRIKKEHSIFNFKFKPLLGITLVSQVRTYSP